MSAEKRLAMLEGLIEGGSTDAFAHYGLALEYKKLDRWEDALRIFEKLRAIDPAYVPQYLMCGQMLADLDRDDDARSWFEAGIKMAESAGNQHALSELRDALESL
ncbi:MAG: tetratricopeptide repeat protein [Myxococcota bacterium]